MYYGTVVTRELDTDERASEALLNAVRKIPVSRKLGIVFDLTETLLRLTEAGVRQLYPSANEREIFLRAAARRLDRETMMRVYGWAPDR